MLKNKYSLHYLLIIFCCLWLPAAFAQLCGNGSRDTGEECDLGTTLNSGSAFGCLPTCQTVPGWTCNKNAAEFRQKEMEAQQYYVDLSAHHRHVWL